MRRIVVLIAFILCGIHIFADDSIIQRLNPKKFSLHVEVSLQNNNLSLSDLIVDLPVPQNSIEQEIQGVNLFDGILNDDNQNHEEYAIYTFNNNLPKSGESKKAELSYNATLYEIKVDFSKIENVLPYDTTSEVFIENTKSDLPIIDTNNSDIIKIAKTIWEKNPTILGYARAAYEYVAGSYKYKNANTGLHPLAQCLKENGGDCGNLSSIYISLLRTKGIPARHVVAIRADGTFHVWAEFYLEQIGWIPVDVTFKNSNSKGDYFGKLTQKNAGVILNRKVNVEVKEGDKGFYQMPLFQTFGYWYWTSSGKGNVIPKYKITGKKL
jgi:hypothetical protein